MASCGDGFTWIDVEDCDDATDVETDACSTQCTSSFCGDAVAVVPDRLPVDRDPRTARAEPRLLFAYPANRPS